MVRKKMWVEFDGELSPSRKIPGAHSPLVHDEDGIAHQAVLHDIDEEDDYDYDESDDAEPEVDPAVVLAILAAAVATVVTVVVVKKKVIPRVRTWWVERRKRKRSLAEARAAEGDAERASSEVIVVPTDASAPSITPGTELELLRPAMTSEEWQTRFRAMLVAKAFSDEQWKMLSRARIEDDASRELVAAMQALTPEDVAAGVNRMLEENPELLDDATSAAMAQTLGGGYVKDGQYVPVRSDALGESLHSLDERIKYIDDGDDAERDKR